MIDTNAVTAAHRFGLGARPAELDNIRANPVTWLKAQLTDVSSVISSTGLVSGVKAVALAFELDAAFDAAASAAAHGSSKASDRQRASRGEASPAARFRLLAAAIDRAKRTRQLRPRPRRVRRNASRIKNGGASPQGRTPQQINDEIYNNYMQDVYARTLHATLTPASFRERLVRFWSNHFSVDVNKDSVMEDATLAMEREAIRPHVTGKFVDMLVAVESHQAMLDYLDNWLSYGRHSAVGLDEGNGLNENLARETMELHTMGADAGYTQADVIEYAKAITGWTFGNPYFNAQQVGVSYFDPLFHEPGARTVMGKTYPAGGREQALVILHDFARHPATARHIAQKLAVHFHSDFPPQSLIDRLAAAFSSSDGDLLSVSLALVDAPEMWDGNFQKLRNNEEFLIAAFRAYELDNLTVDDVDYLFYALGQQPGNAGSPAGWPEDVASWASSSILSARLDMAVEIGVDINSPLMPPDYADSLFGAFLSSHSRAILASASTAEQGYALLLAMPEFQRR